MNTLNTLIIFLSLFLMGACSSSSHRLSLTELRKETAQILNEFNKYHIQYRKTNAPKILITMVEDNQMRTPSTIATCKHSPKPYIIVRRTLWERIDYKKKEYILFHELGHCILKRKHKETTIGQIPTSIMFPVYVNNKKYLNYKKEYIKELFTGNESTLVNSIDGSYSLKFKGSEPSNK